MQKNKEINVTTESPSRIKSILMKRKMILKQTNVTIPMKLITSPQAKYDESLNWLEPKDEEQFADLSIDTLKNIFRQGNSIHQSFVSASTQSLLHNITSERVYFFLRSDTLLVAPVRIPCNDISKDELDIPSWQTIGNPQYNDRAALAGSLAAEKYAQAKLYPCQRYIILSRHQNGQKSLHIPRNLRDGKRNLHNPEKMLKMYLDNDVDTKLKIVEKDLDWVQLIRIRTGGEFKFDDAKRWCIRQKKFKDTQDIVSLVRGSCSPSIQLGVVNRKRKSWLAIASVCVDEGDKLAPEMKQVNTARDYMNLTMENHKAYADAHGYPYFPLTRRSDELAHKNVRYHKLIWVKQLLQKYSWVFFTDCDAIFLDFSIDVGRWAERNERSTSELIITGDHVYAMNSGQFLIRNRSWAKSLLDDAMKEPKNTHGREPFSVHFACTVYF